MHDAQRSGLIHMAMDQLAQPGGRGTVYNYIVNNFKHPDDFKKFVNAADLLHNGFDRQWIQFSKSTKRELARAGQDIVGDAVDDVSPFLTPGLDQFDPSLVDNPTLTALRKPKSAQY